MNSSRSSTSSSTASTSSSSSSSCSESGSSSTDSESSSSSDIKCGNETPKRVSDHSDHLHSNATVDRKLPQQKIMAEIGKVAPAAGIASGKHKQNAAENSQLRSARCATALPNGDDGSVSKKSRTNTSMTGSNANPAITPNLKRKNASHGFVMASSRLQKVADVISERNLSGMDTTKMNNSFDGKSCEKQPLSTQTTTLNPDKSTTISSCKQSTPQANFEVKNGSGNENTKKDKESLANVNTTTQHETKVTGKRNCSGQVTPSNSRCSTKRKYVNNYAGNSGTEGSEDGSNSASSDTESDSDSSYSTKAGKGKRCKRAAKSGVSKKAANSDTEDGQNMDLSNRKFTRSLSTRCNKISAKASSEQKRALGSDSDTDVAMDKDTRRAYTKCPTKKAYTGFSNSFNKIKVKKESCLSNVPHVARVTSPLQTEKKCGVEGCDSSGHLGGNADRHFLPEACPIYHNMSTSECKERANQRKLRNGMNANASIQSLLDFTDNKIQTDSHNSSKTPSQKEFYSKIMQSRSNFTPINEAFNNDKVKLEKDCTDEEREPNLNGLVPDYDMQLFRDAQALASEKIEDDIKDLPIGKGIKYITMGKYRMKVWYQSPYPDDVARLPQMYICEFCLRYQKSETGIKRHAQKCVWRHPPGDEIYRKGKLQVWQVDGKKHKQYCQHLCLLAKFFLDHKTLYYDVEPFLFYIMTLADVDGCHIVGYFSKEKNSFYNVSCILTLPPYQRKGYGRLLIDFSYLLTRVEGKIGSPEKPLSDLGLISYRSYWKDVLLDYLCNRSGNTLSIKDVSQEMAIYSYDIVSTLQALGMMKYWKGKHIVLKKQDVLDEYEERIRRRGTFPKIDESCLRWMPFVPTQTNDSS